MFSSICSMLSFLILLHTCFAQLQRSTTLNALTPSLNGITITYNPETTNIFGSSYNISVKTQHSYDIALSLAPKWSFKATTNTTLILTLNGATPNPTADADFMILFTAGNTQFFSFFVHLDITIIRSHIYPFTKLATKQNITAWLSDIDTYPQRWDRISDGNQWVVSKPRFNTPAQWPLQFQIENNIALNTCILSYFDQAIIYKTGNTFNDSFHANTPLNIYIMGDTSKEQYQIHDINIQLYHANGIPTIPPTLTPTKSPSQNPTTFPSQNPLKSPSQNPTQNPFKTPSTSPSNFPSQLPTVFPSNFPSKTPSDAPSVTPVHIFSPTTHTPSFLPTMEPTMYPTKVPSHISVAPSIKPTYTPSISPSLHPSVSPSNTPSITPTFTSLNPTYIPTFEPTISPTFYPTNEPKTHITPTYISLSKHTQFNSTIPDIIIHEPTRLNATSYLVIIIIFTAICFGAVTILLVVAKRNHKKSEHKIQKEVEVIAVAAERRLDNPGKLRNYDKINALSISPAFKYNKTRLDSHHIGDTMTDDIRVNGILHDLETHLDEGSDSEETEETTVSNKEQYNNINIAFLHNNNVQDGYEETETKLSEEDTKYDTDDGFVDRTMPNPFKKMSDSQSKSINSEKNYMKKFEVNQYQSIKNVHNPFGRTRDRVLTHSQYDEEYKKGSEKADDSSTEDSYHDRMGTYDFVENLQVLHEHAMAINNTNNNNDNIENVMRYLDEKLKKKNEQCVLKGKVSGDSMKVLSGECDISW